MRRDLVRAKAWSRLQAQLRGVGLTDPVVINLPPGPASPSTAGPGGGGGGGEGGGLDGSPGAAARYIVADALDQGYERILILGGDIVLHRHAGQLFSDRYRETPHDWRMLLLGVRQDDWSDDKVRWMSPRLYSSPGGSTASAFAVGLAKSAFPYMLAQLRSSLPLSTGAIQAMQRAFPNQCYVFLPNLAVLDPDAHQDIGPLEWARHRWNMSDYG